MNWRFTIRVSAYAAVGALLAHMGYTITTWQFWVMLVLVFVVAATSDIGREDT